MSMDMDNKVSTKPADIDQQQLDDDNYRESEDEDYKDDNEGMILAFLKKKKIPSLLITLAKTAIYDHI